MGGRMNRYAVIRDGVVVNIIKWNGGGDYSLPHGTQAVADDGAAWIGAAWNGQAFSERPRPPEEDPEPE